MHRFENVCYRMGHTSVGHLTTDFEANRGGNIPDTVFFADWRDCGTGTVGGWDTIHLQLPFEYNGHDNLLVEVTWIGQAGGDGDQVVRYGFSPDGSYRRCFEWNWQASTAQRADNHAYNTLIGFGSAGVVKITPEPIRRAQPTLVRNVLGLECTSPGELIDPAGRRVADLSSGDNDISRLRPGTYFLVTSESGVMLGRKILVLR